MKGTEKEKFQLCLLLSDGVIGEIYFLFYTFHSCSTDFLNHK